MRDKSITRKITQGVYVLTTDGAGCVVDAVSQVSSGSNPLISVAVMKTNYTNEVLHEKKVFALSVLGEEVSGQVIQTFGLNSMRDVNKFSFDLTKEIDGLQVVKDSLGYMICEVVDTIDTESHTLFIGRLIEADCFSDSKPMSYLYYHEHKDELIKVNTDNNKTAWVCTVCGYVFYGDELPDGFKCPKCGVDASLFRRS